MDIDKISFTGSVIAGKKVQELATKSNLKHVTLELGGKSPSIIFEDANIEAAVTQASQSFLLNSGQICAAASRTFVHEKIASQVVEALKAAYQQFDHAVGDPQSDSTFLGPLADKKQYEKVMNFIEIGKKDAKLLVGGERHGDTGNFIQPTIFVDPVKDSRIYTDEIFGPVMVLKTFKTEEEALQLANATSYGLAAYMHTTDVTRALRVSAKLEAGTVYVNGGFGVSFNTPFGGWKQSGNGGRESGKYGLMEYLQTKTVLIRLVVSAFGSRPRLLANESKA